MNGHRIDYTLIDHQIIEMRQAGVKVRDVAEKLGIGVSTVGMRMMVLGLGKPKSKSPRRKRADSYCPTPDESRTLAFLLTTASSVMRRTGATSDRVISTVMELASQGKLDIRKVAQ